MIRKILTGNYTNLLSGTIIFCLLHGMWSDVYSQKFAIKDASNNLNNNILTNKITEDSLNYYIITTDKEGFWEMGTKNANASVLVLDHKFETMQSIDIVAEKTQKLTHITPRQLYCTQNNLIVFATQVLITRKTTAAYLFISDKNKGSVTRQICLSEIEMPEKDNLKDAVFNFKSYTLNGKVFYLFIRNHEASWTLSRSVEIKLFDCNLSELFSNTETFPYNSMDCEIMDVSMNGLGEIIFLLRLEPEFKSFTFRVFVFNPATNATISFPLDELGYKTENISVQTNSTGHTLIYGLSSKSSNKNRAFGIRHIYLSKDSREIISQGIITLADTLLKKDNNLSFKDLYPAGAIFINDTTFFTGFQLKQKKTNNITDNEGRIFFRNTYTWENTFFFKIDGSGNLSKIIDIPLLQESVLSDEQLGLAATFFADNLIFTYNNNVKNYEIKKSQKQKPFAGKGVPVVTKYSLKTGKQEIVWPEVNMFSKLNETNPRSYYINSGKLIFTNETTIGQITF